MTLQEILGTDYREDMTLEELEKALADKEISISKEPVVKKRVFDNTASDLAKLKKELKDLKEESMSDSELLQAEMDKAKEEQTRYKRELAKLRAKEVFVTAGLKEEDFSPILESIISEDETVTKTRAEDFVNIINSQKDAVDKAVRKELLDSTPTPPAGIGKNTEARYEKEIAAATESGDMATAASLIRQQAMNQKEI